MRSRRGTYWSQGRRIAGAAALTAALMLAAGCAEDGEDPATDPPVTEPEEQTAEPDEEETIDPDEEETTDPGGGEEDPRVEAAVEHLADREGVDPADIEVGALEAVTWSDGSIGCPEEGMSYTQALVDGHRLILSLDGVEYFYHSGGEDELSYCADPIEPADVPATS